mmetsp:Transcript_37063/g.57949  ORF Transcript_37063/g.57949 Transcript_37063/m.57949 type:complete len:134 (+) Transcript_37063:281-682(+)
MILSIFTCFHPHFIPVIVPSTKKDELCRLLGRETAATPGLVRSSQLTASDLFQQFLRVALADSLTIAWAHAEPAHIDYALQLLRGSAARFRSLQSNVQRMSDFHPARGERTCRKGHKTVAFELHNCPVSVHSF